MPAPIHLAEYDPAWPAQFTALAQRVGAALGDRVLRIEHVGSTAVRGLAAKPILDIDAVVRTPADLEPASGLLEKSGYQHEGDRGIPGRHAFHWPAGAQRHHLYLLAEGSPELQRHLAFRDALRSDPLLRAQYLALKRALAERFPFDREAYTQGKGGFIESTLSRVLAASA